MCVGGGGAVYVCAHRRVNVKATHRVDATHGGSQNDAPEGEAPTCGGCDGHRTPHGLPLDEEGDGGGQGSQLHRGGVPRQDVRCRLAGRRVATGGHRGRCARTHGPQKSGCGWVPCGVRTVKGLVRSLSFVPKPSPPPYNPSPHIMVPTAIGCCTIPHGSTEHSPCPLQHARLGV